MNRSVIWLIPVLVLGILGTAHGAEWVLKSSTNGDLPVPNAGDQQTCCIVADLDGDGVDDFVVGERTQAPAVTWFKYANGKWQRFVIDAGMLTPEAGGDACDIDGDGDLDIVLGGDSKSNEMWWWENPSPDFSKPWVRRTIKNTGKTKHHDQSFADYDGDGRTELVSWNQKAKQLLLFEIPDDPKHADTWPATVIYTWDEGQELEGFPSIPTDIDGDGQVDIVGGGRWFKHMGGKNFEARVIDDALRFTQCAAGQLVEGGWAEVVVSPGDYDGVAKWFSWDGTQWTPHELRAVVHGHTCEVRDINADGHLDIFIAEMGSPGAGDEARNFVWYGDGKGGFKETVVHQGQGNHEGKVADLDGDGDLDVLVKPYNHHTPKLEVLLNPGK